VGLTVGVSVEDRRLAGGRGSENRAYKTEVCWLEGAGRRTAPTGPRSVGGMARVGDPRVRGVVVRLHVCLEPGGGIEVMPGMWYHLLL
jgi:hypothetical protein